MFGWFKKLELFGRAGAWPRVRREHLSKEPNCVVCGRRPSRPEVHHVQSYHEHPELELDPDNLATVCDEPCHQMFGHLRNWKKINPHFREDADRFRKRVQDFG